MENSSENPIEIKINFAQTRIEGESEKDVKIPSGKAKIKKIAEKGKPMAEGEAIIKVEDYTAIYDETMRVVMDNKTARLLQANIDEESIKASQEVVKKFCKEKGYHTLNELVEKEKTANTKPKTKKKQEVRTI